MGSILLSKKLKATKSRSNGGSGDSTGLSPMAGKGRIENLRPPWKPGESGNLAGRPRRRPISDAYAERLQRPVLEKFRRELDLWEGATWADAIAAALAIAACRGSVAEARELREATEGKTSEGPKEISGPIEFLHIYEQLESKNLPGVTSKTKPREGS
jgi:hypothetical protein